MAQGEKSSENEANLVRQELRLDASSRDRIWGPLTDQQVQVTEYADGTGHGSVAVGQQGGQQLLWRHRQTVTQI